MGQIDLNDGNWESVINDDFNGVGRSWNAQNFWETGVTRPIWLCYHPEYWPCVILPRDFYDEITQPSNAVFLGDKLLLIAKYYNSLTCGLDYYFPSWTNCDSCAQGSKTFHYLTGTLESITKNYGFGYYEIRCRQPIHTGVHTCFWLFGCGPTTYEEIDIMEYSSGCWSNDPFRGYSSGIWHNPNGTNYAYNSSNSGAQKYGEVFHHISASEPDLNNWHSFGCEWMPDYVKWYRDGILVAEYHDKNHIPKYCKAIKTTYAVKSEAANTWHSSDTLVVDYLKYYRLKTDCDEDVVLRSISDFQDYQPSVKGSITMGSSFGLSLPTSLNLTMRASRAITIDHSIEFPKGASVTFIIQECPERENKIGTNIQ